MGNTIQDLQNNGQSIWCDNISRSMIDTGELNRLIDLGVVGVTSNPTIFMKAITGGSDYDTLFHELMASGKDQMGIYEGLVMPDIADAADALRPVYDRTDGVDGFVSLEVNPKLAFDTDATVAEARRLFAQLNRTNILIKVPATDEGIPAIEKNGRAPVGYDLVLIFDAPHRQVLAAGDSVGREQLLVAVAANAAGPAGAKLVILRQLVKVYAEDVAALGIGVAQSGA